MKCKHCGDEIVFNGVLWVAVGELVFPQYCFERKNTVHEPQEKKEFV